MSTQMPQMPQQMPQMPTQTPLQTATPVSDEERQLWRKRVSSAENDQRNYHPLWFEILAFCQGYHWVKYAGSNPTSRQLVTTPPPKHGRRYTVDELTQYRLTLLGELASDDDRPQAHFRADDRPVENYAAQANLALAYGWEEEWLGNRTLQEGKRTMIDLGTAPMRCRFDPGQGPMTDERPFQDGQMLSRQDAYQAIDQGQQVQMRSIREGRIIWDAGLPFNALVPPGIPREWDFPWIIWKSIGYLPDLKVRYPQVAADLSPDAIRSIATMSRPAEVGPRGYQAENLGEHCFLYTCYQLASPRFPQGRMIIFGCEKLVPLEGFDSLPYRAPDKTWRAGVYFLHAIRLGDRFWSRGFMENALDPQRAINEHATRIEQTIAHGQPFRWIEEGSIKKLPDGSAGSVGWLKIGKPRPQTDPGMAPGAWMYDVIRAKREDLARAVLPEAALGENPVNVTTYSQLALLHSQARKRLASIIRQNQETVIHMMEDSIWDIRTKWGPEKQFALAGEGDQLQAYTFNASVWPDFYKIGFATGSLPRTQEAHLKLIEDMWNAALQAQAAMRDPDAWLAWRKQSLEAGKVLSLPTAPVDDSVTKAEYENEQIIQRPDPAYARSLVDYFDNHSLHITHHRSVQSAARLMGRDDVFVAFEIHCKEHERQAMLTAMQSVGTPGPTMPHGPIAGLPSQTDGLPQPQVNVAAQGGQQSAGGQQRQGQ